MRRCSMGEYLKEILRANETTDGRRLREPDFTLRERVMPGKLKGVLHLPTRNPELGTAFNPAVPAAARRRSFAGAEQSPPRAPTRVGFPRPCGSWPRPRGRRSP